MTVRFYQCSGCNTYWPLVSLLEKCITCHQVSLFFSHQSSVVKLHISQTHYVISGVSVSWMLPKSLPDSSVGKESSCNAGDSGSIPGLGRSDGGGIGYPLQYSWVSLVVQLVKNPPAMQETWVRFLGWEYPWKRERLSTPVFWPGEFHGPYRPWGRRESDMTELLHSLVAQLIKNLPAHEFG